MKLIIDISEHNGPIDLKLASKYISGIIARCSWGWGSNQIDKQWENTAKQANQLNFPLFAYHFCYARNTEEAILEAKLAIKACENFNVNLIYYDMEYSSFQGNLTNDDYYKIALAFCNTIEAAGYSVGIYANEYWFKTKLTNQGFSAWTLWIANYGNNNGYDNWNGELKYNPFGNVLLHQFTSNAKSGILSNLDGINSTFLDCNLDYGMLNVFSSNNISKFKIGDSVKVKSGSNWYDLQSIPNFVYENNYIIFEIIKDRVVIGIDNQITGAISINNIYHA